MHALTHTTQVPNPIEKQQGLILGHLFWKGRCVTTNKPSVDKHGGIMGDAFDFWN